VLSFYGPFAWLFKQALGSAMDGRISLKEALPDYHIRNGAKFPPLLCINEDISKHRKSHDTWGGARFSGSRTTLPAKPTFSSTMLRTAI